jgi:hypothetical protein
MTEAEADAGAPQHKEMTAIVMKLELCDRRAAIH